MQGRVAFNSGEFAPEMEVRADLDQYSRGCSVLENWNVNQLGGVSRRRGMRFFAHTHSENARLIPYVYSYHQEEDVRFLVELDCESLRVLDLSGVEVASFSADTSSYKFYFETAKVSFFQVNRMLFLTSVGNPPMVLKYDGEGEWEFEPWVFKHRPWRYEDEQRDESLIIKHLNGDSYSVEFSDNLEENEKTNGILSVDFLRASYWVPQAESEVSGSVLRSGVQIKDSVPDSASYGEKFAVKGEEEIKYWTCSAAWPVSNYVAGMDSPGNYPNNFVAAENVNDDFKDVVPYWSIKDVMASGTIAKGTKIAIKNAYWQYYTCIKDFSASDKEDNYESFEDYPAFFVSGIAAGAALPCKGAWSFNCSGVWVGSYEVRRNYEDSLLNEKWESRGVSFSHHEAVSNTAISGDEKNEECWLRLFLTRSRCMNEGSIVDGFVPDYCGNRLVVEGYKHNMVLKYTPVLSDDGLDVTSFSWSCVDKVQAEVKAYRSVSDWSWQAFSDRYGYPSLCCIFQQRLVFAATYEQPQTIWMSRIDDFDNFLSGEVDDAAIANTLYSMSQNPICWMQSQTDRLLLGTSETVYSVISGSNATGITASNARVLNHAVEGSDGVTALSVVSKALYVSRGGGNVVEMGYNYESDGYITRHLSLFAPHIAKEHGGFKSVSLQTSPDTVVLFVLGDGQLALCTYNNMQEVRAWHRWVTDGRILSVCAMPDGLNSDRLFLIVRRSDKNASGYEENVTVSIEVVDSASPFVDNGNRDYLSVAITTPLNSAMDEYIRRQDTPGFLVRFGSPFMHEQDSVQVTIDGGETWTAPAFEFAVLKGWQKAIGQASWKYEKKAGIRVHGDRALEILAIQG